jgi:predicted acylesterase/phospholipase RssA
MGCTAFVFGGGGLLGACEAGMAQALLERGAPRAATGLGGGCPSTSS